VQGRIAGLSFNLQLVETVKMSEVLIVDDSHSIRELLTSVLQKAGYGVTSADNGQVGLETAQSSNYDLVITDINMPVMDGLELLSNLRSLPEYSFKPILILTTEFSQEMKMKGKQAGATGWLVKPFDPDKLISVIARILN